jgi:cell division protease FtsH
MKSSRPYQHAKDLLVQNRKSLIELAELLLQKEVIFKDDLEGILGRRHINESGQKTGNVTGMQPADF